MAVVGVWGLPRLLLRVFLDEIRWGGRRRGSLVCVVEVFVDELLGRGGLRGLDGVRQRSGFLVELKRRELFVRVSLCIVLNRRQIKRDAWMTQF